MNALKSVARTQRVKSEGFFIHSKQIIALPVSINEEFTYLTADQFWGPCICCESYNIAKTLRRHTIKISLINTFFVKLCKINHRL